MFEFVLFGGKIDIFYDLFVSCGCLGLLFGLELVDLVCSVLLDDFFG